MTNIDFFKQQAKLLLKDWKAREQRCFSFDIKELFRLYNVDPHTVPTLMKAQHLLALAMGRKSWAELINDSEDELSYTRQAFLENAQEESAYKTMVEKKNITNDIDESEAYHGIVECLHCGQRFPIDKPNHLPSCDGMDWDLIPVDN